MNEIGERVESVLKESFPQLVITAEEISGGQTLRVFAGKNLPVVAFATPATTDYRTQSYQLWVHRFSELINKAVAQ